MSAENTARYLTYDHPHGYSGFRIGVIGKYSYINEATIYLNRDEHGKVTNLQIGSHCSFGLRISLLFNRNHDHMSLTTSTMPQLSDRPWVTKQKGQIVFGHDVWVGNSVIVLPGVRIGSGAIIGAGSVISSDIPPYAVAVGNPSKIIRYRYTQEQIEKLLQIRWWTWSDEALEAERSCFSRPVEEFIARFWKNGQKPAITKKSKEKIQLLFFLDFDDPYPLWTKIIREYMTTFSASDPVSLMLVVRQSEKPDHVAAYLNTFIDSVGTDSNMSIGQRPEIALQNIAPETEEDLFRNTDFYITGRDIRTLDYIQYGDDYGVKLITGVDIPALEREKILSSS
jgi:virginiamycin A acetyltransferase